MTFALAFSLATFVVMAPWAALASEFAAHQPAI